MENENKTAIDFDGIRSLANEDKTIQAKLLDIVKSTETGKAYAETIAKNYFEENVGHEHKKIYDFVDQALIGAGLEKPQGVKTSEWAAMIANQNKEMSEQINALKSNTDNTETLNKIEELKKRHKKEKEQFTIDAKLKKRHKKEKEQFTIDAKREIESRDSELNALKNKLSSLNKSNEINSVINSFEFNKSLDEGLIKDVITLKTQQLIANSVEEDGKIVWMKADGTPYKDGILNADLSFILKQELGSIIAQSNPGGNAGNDPTKGGDIVNSQVVMSEDSFKTQEQFLQEFDKIAQRKGIPKGEEYNKLYWDAFERYNVKTLREF
jgi:hypothetical protein